MKGGKRASKIHKQATATNKKVYNELDGIFNGKNQLHIATQPGNLGLRRKLVDFHHKSYITMTSTDI